MKKILFGGFSAVSALVALAMLAASHTAVSVASCDYCKVKTIAEVQSDALDRIAIAEKAKAEMIVAADTIHIEKLIAEKEISASFAESYKQVENYVTKEKTDADIVAELELDASMFKRFDQTRASYELATNTLISNDSAPVGSGKTSKH